MVVKPMLMGAEVEYSMSNRRSRSGAGHAQLHRRLLDAVQVEHRWLADAGNPTGIYIDNGSRYYLDSGNHNEFSSPELFTPRQIAVYDRAAEQILLSAQAVLKRGKPSIDICITKNNVNFNMPDQAAWGQHEAYTCWIPLEAAARQLIPHLVSRSPYAGAGCLSADPAGMGYELSQRARHMTRLTGKETTRARAIFCTRACKPSDVSPAGWTRTNLISKDSQRCSFGMYLSYGVTSLLLMIMNEGHEIGRDVQLKDPLTAMRTISLDPWLRSKVRLTNGKPVTAIDIQRAYLREAERHVASGHFPDWTREVLEHWSTTLDQLKRDPLELASRLDTYMKLRIFDHQLTRMHLTWATFRKLLQVLEKMRRTAPELVVSAVLNGSRSGLNASHADLYDQLSSTREVIRAGMDRLRFAVRLQALELNYHELGGLFDQMSAAGQVDPVVVTVEEVQHAVHHPPRGGRAEARGQSIADFHGQPWTCDWQFVINHEEERWIDLRDPFTNQRRVTCMASERSQPNLRGLF